uniref:SH3 domain-containing protein n=2 Tax=Mesocestoides corti TaxID=53468 RepID=A0A5K3F5J9_MESCO
MFRTCYAFEAKFQQSISFSANDYLLGLRKENDHWLFVYHVDGRLGAVPINYVEKSEAKPANEVSKIIESALVAIAEKDIYDKFSIINYLQQLKKSLLSGSPPESAPSFPVRYSERQCVKPSDAPSSVTVESACSLTNETSESITKRSPGIGFLMLDKLRTSTCTSFDRCVHGFIKMLNVLSDADPQYATLSKQLISEVLDPNSSVARSVYSRTQDWKGLQKHVRSLENKMKDQQENSWPLVEDDATVINDLDLLTTLICNASADMVRTFLSDDRLPVILSYLYQREKRAVVRRFYLLISVATCHIQPTIWSVYLDSGLPMEVIRELKSSEICQLDLILNFRVLTVLFARSGSLPVNLYNELDESFFGHIFAMISRPKVLGPPPSGDFTSVKAKTSLVDTLAELHLTDGDAPPPTRSDISGNTTPSELLLDSFVRLVCAANRHFCASPSAPMTPILKTMLNNHNATGSLIERLLHLFNRGVDPLDVDGVAFVRQFRRALHTGLDDASQLYDATAPYQDTSASPDPYRSAKSYDSLSLHNGASEVGTSCSDEYSSDVDEEPRSVCSKRGASPQANLTEATLHLDPDTPRNAARKLIADIFSDSKTAKLVYCNDVEVVVDVIIRHLCDLPASSPDLPEFIYCLDKVIRNSDYMSRVSGPYRLQDLTEALLGVEGSAGGCDASKFRDFTTPRSLRLANGVLSLLRSTNGSHIH